MASTDSSDGDSQPGLEPAGEVVDGEHAAPRAPDDRRVVWSESFSGPLPPPSVLVDYENTVPGLAREIVDQWKGETAHRHKTVDAMRELDEKAMTEYYAAERRGQLFSLIVFAGIIAVAILAVVMESPAIGASAVFAGAGSVIWAMRRRSDGGKPAVNLADGDALERSDKPT